MRTQKQYIHIIKASAGSGKTHRLTGEYIKLLFSQPNNYRHILAVTFTNKATDEMKSRIVEELFNLSSGKRSDYLKELMHIFSLDENVVRSRAKRILESLLHDYSAFSISTIDKFFQQTMRAFTRELGLAGGYNIEVDHTSLLIETVDLMLSELDRPENKSLAEWLLRFMQDNIEEGKSWKIEKEVMKLSQQLFNETYKFFSKEERTMIHDKEQLDKYKQMLFRIIREYESEAKAIGIKAVNIMQQHGLAYDDFKYKKGSGFGLFVKLANGVIEKPGKRLIALVDNIDNWCSDNTKQEAVNDAYSGGLNDCVKDIIELSNDDLEYNTAKELLKNFYTLGILKDIKERLQKLQQENNTLLLSDTTELLNNIISGSDSPFIYEKTGTRISNYMIDEFQDTSRMQWDNFKPLLEESLSTGNFNLIVGDVKQSIYRFRNSDWQLLEKQVEKDFNPDYIEKHVLDTNWRSDKNIVDFNNVFFKRASDLLQYDFDVQAGVTDKSEAGDDSISSAYTDVYQYVPEKKSESGGQVKITFPENDDELNWKEKALERLPHEIEALQDQGFSLKDIAIVVRNNPEAVLIAETLIKYRENNPGSPYKYDIISNEALIIGSAQSIKAIIALMRYFRNPNDRTSRMLAIYESSMFRQKYTPSEALQCIVSGSINSQGDFPEEFKEKLGEMSSMPFYDMIEGFFALNVDYLDNKENAYVQAFLDIALKFSSERSADLNAFLDWWDEEGYKKTLFSPEDQDAIRLITIHKSKGLGFGAVIMPFVNWNVDHNSFHNNIIWCKPDTAPFDMLNIAPLKYSSKLAGTIFKEDYLKEKLYTYIDNINLLYVAFTRARHRLIIYAPKPAKADKITNVADLLWLSVSETPDKELGTDSKPYIALNNYFSEIEGEWVFQYGVPTTVLPKYDRNAIQTYKTGKWHSVPYENRLKLRLNYTGFFSDDGSRDYGKLMHDIVSNVRTLTDIPDAVNIKISDGELNEADRENIINEITGYLSIPEASDWYSGNYKVLNETQVLKPGATFSRPDRIMIGENKVIIVDYKFGVVEDSRYLNQVKRYVKSITGMGYQNVKGAVFYVKSGKIVNV